MATMRASTVSEPTWSARMTRAPVPLTVPPITRSPACFATGIDSPVTIDSSTTLPPSSTVAVDRHAVPGTDAQAVAGLDLVERDLLVRAVGGDAPGRLRCEVEQRADRAAGLLAGAQFQHLAEQHQHRDDGGGLEVHRDAHVRPCGSRPGKTPGAIVATTL